MTERQKQVMPDKLEAVETKPGGRRVVPSATTGVSGEAPGLRITLPISGLTCPACVQAVERALRAVPGVRTATVNFAWGLATAEYDPRQTTVAALYEAIKAAGYRAVTARAWFGIQGMTCASCIAKIEDAVLATPGVLKVSVSLGTEEAEVEYLPSVTELAAVKAAVASAGYPVVEAPRPAGPAALDRETEDREKEYSSLMRKWWFGAAVGAFTMIMSYPWIFPLLGAGFPRGSPQLWPAMAAGVTNRVWEIRELL
ncbi:MAG: copper ion binding protein [Candidatus Rokubacteria bacterium]|nr:copper ion binding protein [Candidatus Rokubacteria bacterium]